MATTVIMYPKPNTTTTSGRAFVGAIKTATTVARNMVATLMATIRSWPQSFRKS
ncbi:MAG: hypothetical protein QOH96_627 [Blastocatellia bacterium]|nr:hypothetical protein [Blastocatellia bacterium]